MLSKYLGYPAVPQASGYANRHMPRLDKPYLAQSYGKKKKVASPPIKAIQTRKMPFPPPKPIAHKVTTNNLSYKDQGDVMR